MSTIEPDRHLTHLDDLLVEYFTGAEFVRLIERSHGPAVLADLPVSAESPRIFMYHAVRALQRLGLLNAAFLDALADARPARRAEIRCLTAAFAGLADSVARPSTNIPQELAEAPRLAHVEALELNLLARERIPAIDDRSIALEQTIDAPARKVRDTPPLTPRSSIAASRPQRVRKTRRRKPWGVEWNRWWGANLRTVRTSVRNQTLGKRRVRPPRMEHSAGRTPFRQGSVAFAPLWLHRHCHRAWIESYA